jgi:hypothetical protein
VGWIAVNDFFQVYSVREDFTNYVNWFFYFINAFYGYFLFGVILILIGLVLFGLIKRLNAYRQNINRG